MGIQRQRIGALHSLVKRSQRRSGGAKRSVRAVHVEPHALVRAHVRDLGQGIDRARIDGPGAPGDAEGATARGAVFRDRAPERAHVHSQPGVGRHGANRRRSQSQDFGGLAQSGVSLVGQVEHEPRPAAREPFLPHVPSVVPRGPVARGGQPDQARDRAAARQESHAPVDGKSHQLHQPPDDGALEIDRRVIAPRHARVERRGQNLGRDGFRRRRRVHPAEEAGMSVSHGVRQDLLAGKCEGRLGGFALRRERKLEQRAAFFRREGSEDGRAGDGFQVIGGQIGRLARQGAKSLAVDHGLFGHASREIHAPRDGADASARHRVAPVAAQNTTGA